MRKPRTDSVLKTLPDERQRSIIELLRTKSLAKVRSELAQDGIQTSSAALSEFFSWWNIRDQYRQFDLDAQNFVELLKRQRPNITHEELTEYGNLFFQQRAISTQDLKGYTRITSARTKAELERLKLRISEDQLKIRQEELSLAREKFRRDTCELFLKWAEDQRAKDISAGSGSHAEKIEKLGQLMFGEDWQ